MKKALLVKILIGIACSISIISNAKGQASVVTTFNEQMHASYGTNCPPQMFKFGNTNSSLCSKIVAIAHCPQGGYPEPNGSCGSGVSAICSFGVPANLPVGTMVCISEFSYLPYGTPSPTIFSRCMAEGLGRNRPIPPELVCEQLTFEKYGYGNVTQSLVGQCMKKGEGTGRFYNPEEVCKKMALNIWDGQSDDSPLWIPVR